MRAPLILSLCVGALLLSATGCAHRRDQVLIKELETENTRLASKNDDLQRMVEQLTRERNAAQENAAKHREQVAGLSRQLQGMVGSDMLPDDIFEVDEDRLILKQDFAFNSGSADLTAKGQEGVRKLAELLRSGEYARAGIIVEGHTDNTKVARRETVERFGDNWGLSAMRAASVIRALQKHGVSAQRLRGMFSGEYRPRAMGKSAEAKARNRRVEIYLTAETR